MPKGHKFSWVDDDDAQPFEQTPVTVAPDPPDVGPLPEGEDEGVSADASNYVEDDSAGDDEDEDDAPPALCTPPAGFTIASSPTFLPAALVPKAPEQQQLVGRSILYHWPSVGWCVGLITEANRDRRRTIMIDGAALVANFFVHYEIDGETPKHRLMLEQYGGEDTHCWVLLEPAEPAAPPRAAAPAAPAGTAAYATDPAATPAAAAPAATSGATPIAPADAPAEVTTPAAAEAEAEGPEGEGEADIGAAGVEGAPGADGGAEAGEEAEGAA